MRLLTGWVLTLILMKLSLDDLRTRWVRDLDLVVLCVCGLALFKSKTLSEWGMILIVIFGLALMGKLRQSMGSGDLSVILTLGLMMDLSEFLVALQSAALMALLSLVLMKKALQSEVPFVPYLSAGLLIVYLIRLRLIFS